MPRQGNGVFQQPANTAAVSGQTISSTAYNSLTTDIGAEITNSLDRAGRSSMSAALPMGGNKITGAADPTAAQDVATKNYVDTTTVTFFSTGDIKLTLKTVADAGWRMFDDGTIGNVSSGATFANVAAQALYTLIWNNVSDTWAPVTGSRGASAAADWSAQKPIALPKVLGRALAMAGAGPGAGLTARAVGQVLGEETHLLTVGEMPVHTHGTTESAHTHGPGAGIGNFIGGGGGTTGSGTGANTWGAVSATASATTGLTINNAGGGGAHNVMQPTTFLNVMVRL